jgi:hypothetical protein
MFDIIPADNDELAVTVEIKRIDNAKAAPGRWLNATPPDAHNESNRQTHHTNCDEDGEKRADPAIKQRAQRHAQLFSKRTGASAAPTWHKD